MSQSSIKKKGYLAKLPVKGLVKKWNRRWFVLHATTHEGVVRLEYYDTEELARNDVGKRTIPLRESSPPSTGVGDKLHPYVFQLTTQIGNHVLAAESHPELDAWMESIKQAVQEDRLKRRRTKAQTKVTGAPSSDPSQSFNESGISYKNRIDSGTYRVTVEENETSTKMNLSGTYNLELTPSMMIMKAPSGAIIFNLSYRFLKNYGKQSGQFHFQTGKNSPIGEGKLILVTTSSKEVFGIVHTNIKKLRETMQQRNLAEERAKSPEAQQQNRQPAPTQAQQVARPMPQKSVQAPPPPVQQVKRPVRTSIGNRPGSRHSGEVPEGSTGTYRTSQNLEETGNTKEEASVDPSAMYASVDYSKKTSRRKEDASKNAKANSSSQPEEAIYSDPYEEDPAYRPPAIPKHKTVATQDSRASVALVELEENAFNDSFDEDEGEDEYDGTNLEPLTEGASNPLDDLDFSGGFPGENEASSTEPPPTTPSAPTASVLPAPTPTISAPSVSGLIVTTSTVPAAAAAAAATDKTATGIMKDVGNLDFGFGPGNLEPQPGTTGAADNSKPPDAGNPDNLMNFDFDFGNAFPANSGDPFSSDMLAAGAGTTGNFADFDLGKLDSNFFDKLENLDVANMPNNDAWATGPPPTMNPQDLDPFWSGMDSSAPKFE